MRQYIKQAERIMQEIRDGKYLRIDDTMNTTIHVMWDPEMQSFKNHISNEERYDTDMVKYEERDTMLMLIANSVRENLTEGLNQMNYVEEENLPEDFL